MRNKPLFRIIWALTILLAFTLGCKMVDQVNDVIALATDVGGLATDINLEGLATDIDIESLVTDVGSIATEIDLEALTTEMESISTDMGSFLTDIPIFEEGTPGPVATPSGFPTDIPLMTGAITDMTGTPTQLNYTVEADLDPTVAFYRGQMVALGWTEQSYTPGEGTATLVFQKANRRATIRIEEGLLFDVDVAITLEG